MTIDEVLFDTEEKMLKTEEHVLNQFAGVRTGKATPSLIENVMVEAYGSNMRLSPLGVELIEAYRAVEKATADAVAQRFGGIETRLRPGASDPMSTDPARSDPSASDP